MIGHNTLDLTDWWVNFFGHGHGHGHGHDKKNWKAKEIYSSVCKIKCVMTNHLSAININAIEAWFLNIWFLAVQMAKSQLTQLYMLGSWLTNTHTQTREDT